MERSTNTKGRGYRTLIGAASLAVGPLRWPAVVLLMGIVLIVAEIASSQVLLSQIGNFLVWSGSVAFAWLLVRGVQASSSAPTGQAASSAPAASHVDFAVPRSSLE
jgi:hypothetical protein